MSSAAPQYVTHEFRPSRLSLLLDRSLTWVVVALVVGVVLFLLAPLIAVVGTSFNKVPSVVFPPETLTLTSYLAIDPNLYGSFFLSVQLAVLATCIGALIAIPGALGLARGRLGRPRLVAEALFRAPLQVPELVTVVALFQFYVVLYGLLAIPLRGTFVGLLAAHVLLVAPYMLVALQARLVALGSQLEEAAEGLGESPLRTFVKVTVPMMRPGLIAAGAMSFVISFDNVPISLFLASPGASPFPVALFTSFELSVSPTIYAAATVALVLSIVATLLVERFVGLRTVLSL